MDKANISISPDKNGFSCIFITRNKDTPVKVTVTQAIPTVFTCYVERFSCFSIVKASLSVNESV